MEKKSTKRGFSEEFKLEAVEMAVKIGIPKAADELGIHPTSIRTWRNKFQASRGPSGPPEGKQSYSNLEKENRRLRKENGHLKEINRVLKKSTAIFSADLMGGLK